MIATTVALLSIIGLIEIIQLIGWFFTMISILVIWFMYDLITESDIKETEQSELVTRQQSTSNRIRVAK